MDVSRESMLARRENCLTDFVVLEHALAASPPEQDHLFAVITSKSCRSFGKCAEDHGAVVIGQFDQARLRDQSAKLDHLARSLAALHNPGPVVSPGASGFEPVSCRCRRTQRC